MKNTATPNGANGNPQLIKTMENNKEDFHFYLNESDIKKLIGKEGFKVYLPRHIFDKNLTDRLHEKHFNYVFNNLGRSSRINYYAHLQVSKNNSEYYNKVCSEQVQKSKEEFEKRERQKTLLEEEKNKPVNRIKSLFGA